MPGSRPNTAPAYERLANSNGEIRIVLNAKFAKWLLLLDHKAEGGRPRHVR